ncbi:helix-hairpin-helix motif domain-containing protein [Toxoplasma gondii CAST]|uniref:Helix-hairpin-helix motif domain-containing protein n=1 Tax=Toxoplasma gondii CAST TaxID=943122 RepID=A0A425HUQ8_TOXGO|nr:helix-hairpin-helix motif domain-containing protein [Toxoplasma gondii CAST]
MANEGDNPFAFFAFQARRGLPPPDLSSPHSVSSPAASSPLVQHAPSLADASGVHTPGRGAPERANRTRAESSVSAASPSSSTPRGCRGGGTLRTLAQPREGETVRERLASGETSRSPDLSTHDEKEEEVKKKQCIRLPSPPSSLPAVPGLPTDITEVIPCSSSSPSASPSCSPSARPLPFEERPLASQTLSSSRGSSPDSQPTGGLPSRGRHYLGRGLLPPRAKRSDKRFSSLSSQHLSDSPVSHTALPHSPPTCPSSLPLSESSSFRTVSSLPSSSSSYPPGASSLSSSSSASLSSSSSASLSSSSSVSLSSASASPAAQPRGRMSPGVVDGEVRQRKKRMRSSSQRAGGDAQITEEPFSLSDWVESLEHAPFLSSTPETLQSPNDAEAPRGWRKIVGALICLRKKYARATRPDEFYEFLVRLNRFKEPNFLAMIAAVLSIRCRDPVALRAMTSFMHAATRRAVQLARRGVSLRASPATSTSPAASSLRDSARRSSASGSEGERDTRRDERDTDAEGALSMREEGKGAEDGERSNSGDEERSSRKDERGDREEETNRREEEALWRKFEDEGPTCEVVRHMSEREIQECIASVNFKDSKARRILLLARTLHSSFRGRIPATYEELVKLPGVGPTIANLLLSLQYGRNEAPSRRTLPARFLCLKKSRKQFSDTEDNEPLLFSVPMLSPTAGEVNWQEVETREEERPMAQQMPAGDSRHSGNKPWVEEPSRDYAEAEEAKDTSGDSSQQTGDTVSLDINESHLRQLLRNGGGLFVDTNMKRLAICFNWLPRDTVMSLQEVKEALERWIPPGLYFELPLLLAGLLQLLCGRETPKCSTCWLADICVHRQRAAVLARAEKKTDAKTERNKNLEGAPTDAGCCPEAREGTGDQAAKTRDSEHWRSRDEEIKSQEECRREEERRGQRTADDATPRCGEWLKEEERTGEEERTEAETVNGVAEGGEQDFSGASRNETDGRGGTSVCATEEHRENDKEKQEVILCSAVESVRSTNSGPGREEQSDEEGEQEAEVEGLAGTNFRVHSASLEIVDSDSSKEEQCESAEEDQDLVTILGVREAWDP